MRTSEKGIHLMHTFEGYRDKPYQCSARIWTVGYGHAMYADQLRLPNARVGNYSGMIRDEYPLKPQDNRVWSKPELETLFKDDLVSFERGVLRLAPNLDGRQAKFDACVCLSYNIGLGNFQRSGIRQKILRGDWENAAEGFLDWSKAGGKVLKGLLRRREAEKALFLSDKED
jgi:lysozyme